MTRKHVEEKQAVIDLSTDVAPEPSRFEQNHSQSFALCLGAEHTGDVVPRPGCFLSGWPSLIFNIQELREVLMQTGAA